MLRFGPCLTGRVGTEFFGMIIGVIVRRYEEAYFVATFMVNNTPICRFSVGCLMLDLDLV